MAVTRRPWSAGSRSSKPASGRAALPVGDAAAKSAPRRLMPGARILRVWKSERHEVHVTETGYLWRGKTYRSLSVIAREITGSRRNGPAFFGLRDGGAA